MRNQTKKLPSWQEAQQFVQAGDNTFQGQSSSHSSGPQTNDLSEIKFSKGVSFDYTNLLTKSSVIKETPRDFNWNLNLGWLTNASVPKINSKNRSSCVKSFKTHKTGLPKPISKIPPQIKSSNHKKNLTLISFTIKLSHILSRIFHSEILKIPNFIAYIKKLLCWQLHP